MENLILECVLRSALVAGGTWLALWLFRVRVARIRHAVWAGVVVLMLALPAWTIWGPKAILRILTPAPVVTTPLADVTQTWKDDAVTAPAVPKTPWTLADSLLTLYLAGLSLLLLRLLTGTLRARLLVRRAKNIDGRMTSGSCVAPVTVGWMKPNVILPPAWTSWTESQLSAVLAHEDEHARRRDPLVQWLALLNRAIFWFHPLAWWLERRLSSLAEEACDDAVLLRGHDPFDYSECLLGMAQVVRESGMRVSSVGMAMPGVSLPQRIRRIAAGANVERVSRTRVLWTAALCTVMAAVFSTTAVGYAPQAPTAATRPVAPPAAAIQAPVILAQAATTPPPPAAAPRAFTLNSIACQTCAGQSLSGVVQDPTGAVVPNASVTLTNSDTKAVVSTATTDPGGKYVLQNFDPGTYSVTVRVPGFKQQTQSGIQITSNDAHNGGIISLQVGEVSTSLSVTALRSAVSPTVLGPMTTLPPSQPMSMSNSAAIEQLKVLTSNYQAQYSDGSFGPKPQRVGGMLTPARLIAQVVPGYPTALRIAGVEGTVEMTGIIGKDGVIVDLKTVGNPNADLAKAAFDAVWKWHYQPTTLNGEPVEVQTTIDVNFTLTN